MLLSQDLLLLPLLHREGPHSPNAAKGLIGYTCRPGNLHGDREIGSSCRQEEVEGKVKENGPGMLGRTKGDKSRIPVPAPDIGEKAFGGLSPSGCPLP